MPICDITSTVLKRTRILIARAAVEHRRHATAQLHDTSRSLASSVRQRFDRTMNANPFLAFENGCARLLSKGGGLMTSKVTVPLPLAFFCGCVTMQYYFGTSDDFFYGSFTTAKDPDDLAEFYQAEDLLKIIAVHPILFDLFMNKVEADTAETNEHNVLLSEDETRFSVKSLGLQVSFEILQQEELIDGESKPTSFMRHERFIDWTPLLDDVGIKVLLWDQTWIYGFKRREDGRFEVYHRGEKFVGPWPVRFLVYLHQHYVLWACEKYINGRSFGTEDLDAQQEELACLPLHVFKEIVGKLVEAKANKLETLQKEEDRNHAAIEQTSKTIQKLSELAERDASSIAIVKRAQVAGSMASASSVKVIASDAETQEVLAAAMKDVSGHTDKAVSAVVIAAMEHPELNYKLRQSKSSRRGRPPLSPEAAGGWRNEECVDACRDR
eukprot:TRINITY_DN47331_c0_g1_i1.p1 TRINITY_DN47331_c0_g1~~TRINITY_DN47331_c0_g1_i1.p1  ORF type:complete len:440 (+),score=101.64 TRINITY_DN47331_c0_g1_i1:158-1477(+)